MSIDELLERIDSIRAEYADRAAPGRSSCIDPSEMDLAREEGARDACLDITSALERLIAEARRS